MTEYIEILLKITSNSFAVDFETLGKEYQTTTEDHPQSSRVDSSPIASQTTEFFELSPKQEERFFECHSFLGFLRDCFTRRREKKGKTSAAPGGISDA